MDLSRRGLATAIAGTIAAASFAAITAALSVPESPMVAYLWWGGISLGVIAVALFVYLWWTAPSEPAPDSPASVFAKASGNAIIDIENATSTADQFAHAKENSRIAARGVKHSPAKAYRPDRDA